MISVLAYLQNCDIPYQELTAAKILWNDDEFKISPIQAILNNNNDRTCKEKEKLYKQNIYDLGVILL
jgi:hypothetical protein